MGIGAAVGLAGHAFPTVSERLQIVPFRADAAVPRAPVRLNHCVAGILRPVTHSSPGTGGAKAAD